VWQIHANLAKRKDLIAAIQETPQQAALARLETQGKIRD
jgi:hypothetical protein